MFFFIGVLGSVLVFSFLIWHIKTNVPVNYGGFPLNMRKQPGLWLHQLILFTIIAVILICFGGLRYYVGTDFGSYAKLFLNIRNDPNYQTEIDFGYVLLNKVIARFTGNPTFLMLTTGSIIVFFYLTRIAFSSKFIPFSVFVAFNLYASSFNLIRQGIAISICFFALEYARNKSWFKFIIFILLAAVFHKTALFFIPICLLFRRKYPVQIYLSVAVAFLAIMLFREQVFHFLLSVFYPVYLDPQYGISYDGNIHVSSVQAFLCAFYTVLCIVYYKPFINANSGNILYVNICVMYLFATLFLSWVPSWDRMQQYFQCAVILIAPEIIACEKNRKTRILYYIAIWGTMLIFWIYGAGGRYYESILS